jgi:hypothetical protein
MNVPFKNRAEAGEELAKKLSRHANRPDVLVLALPRGGVKKFAICASEPAFSPSRRFYAHVVTHNNTSSKETMCL